MLPIDQHGFEKNEIHDEVIAPTCERFHPRARRAGDEIADVLTDGVPVLAGVDAPDHLHREVEVKSIATKVGEAIVVPGILATLLGSQLGDVFPGFSEQLAISLLI